jgi:Fe-S-cluster containining protein
MNDILKRYGALLAEVDDWFGRCIKRFGDAVTCSCGCSECCRGLFDITLLDACYLKSGFERLSEPLREAVAVKAHARLVAMQALWPEFAPPYLLNHRAEEEWEDLMPDDDEAPCVLLDNDGRCLVYDYRPMTCRLHGLPLIDQSGEVMHDEWCTRNFIGDNPLVNDLRWEFRSLFQRELIIFREFTMGLLKKSINELDTFIPTALFIDFAGFPWEEWYKAQQKGED